jgi:DNA-binding transcriptional LysR family regulator
VDAPIELRQLRYFVAVAEELHFGRAAARVHMSQSPLSRAIRELERDLGVVLFVRTTRRVELTAAGTALLGRARRAIAEVELAVADARRAGAEAGAAIGHGPLSRTPARRLADALGGREVRLVEDLSPELLRRVAAHELTAAVVLETPATARPAGVRMLALRDEPLLAAVPAAHRLAGAGAVPLAAFAAERVLLPRSPIGTSFTIWLRARLRVAGVELDDTLETLGAPWDRRMLPVAEGAAVSVVTGDWAEPPIAGVEALPFDPPLTVPFDLATAGADELASTAVRLRDAEGWLSERSRPAGS